MTVLSCSRSLRISHGVLEIESFIPTCKSMTPGFFFKIEIMWWLISVKVTSLKSCTFTKRFLISLFSSIPVIIESPTKTQVPAGHVCLISLDEG